MSRELPPLTLKEVPAQALSTEFADTLAEKIRSLNQTAKHASSVSYPWTDSVWATNTMHAVDQEVGYIGPLTIGATGSQLGNASGTLASTGPGFTYTTNTTSPYSIGSGTYGGQGNVAITNTQFEQSGKMVMKGKEADIEINGKSMSAWMEKVEQRLNILSPNPDMEKEWDELRRLGERYRKLEKKCQEKSQMWEALKKVKPPKL